MDYQKKAFLLIDSGFWIAGLGHFSITVEETARVLEFVENNDFENLRVFYEELAAERL